MLFPEEDAPLLKTWIVKRIENTSDADSDVLADYVIALLKHDGDQDSVRKLCETEIPDFLTEDPKTFLDDVFEVIAYKSYQPGAPPPPKRAAPAPDTQLALSTGPPPSNPKKRGFHDQADFDQADFEESAYGGARAMKQPRRGGLRRGRIDDYRSGWQGGYPPMSAVPLPHGMPSFDPNNPMEAVMRMQAMGLQYPGMPEFPQQGFGGRGQPRRRGRRCRDFDTKGYCSRGNTCMFDHGNESVYVPPTAAQGEEYDPTNPVFTAASQPYNPSHPHSPRPDNSRGRGANASGNNRGRGGRRGGARAAFSSDRPVHDRTKSTIVVENIPEESFSEEEVRGFFAQFGNVTEISMQPYKRLAVVKFDDWAAANAAYRSPKVIFDNRFVKVFWYKDEEGHQHSSSRPTGSSNGTGANGHGGLDSIDAEPEIDPEEFKKRQEEAQSKYQEKEAKRIELEQQRLKLEKQQQELLARHREESERLKAKMAHKAGPEVETSSGTGTAAGTSGTDVLRAQLAALEQEAKFLGIDPEAEDDTGSYGSFRGRAGYRGRGGRGARGSFAPRGRGTLKGQAGRHAAYAQYSLDNRPRKLAVTGVDFSHSGKDELLRHFLLNLGEFESVEPSPTVTHVSFQDRKTADKFYLLLQGKELPGVDGVLDMSWVNTPLPPVGDAGPKTTPTPTSNSYHEDSAQAASAVVGDAMAGFDEAEEAGSRIDEAPEEGEVDMDYDVAGEEGW